MRVLVTGARGKVGTATARALEGPDGLLAEPLGERELKGLGRVELFHVRRA